MKKRIFSSNDGGRNGIFLWLDVDPKPTKRQTTQAKQKQLTTKAVMKKKQRSRYLLQLA